MKLLPDNRGRPDWVMGAALPGQGVAFGHDHIGPKLGQKLSPPPYPPLIPNSQRTDHSVKFGGIKRWEFFKEFLYIFPTVVCEDLLRNNDYVIM